MYTPNRLFPLSPFRILLETVQATSLIPQHLIKISRLAHTALESPIIISVSTILETGGEGGEVWF